MSDKDGGASQADDNAKSQADQTGTSQSQADLKTVKDLPDWAQKELREARKEAADFRTKLQKIEDSSKTDSEKLAARLEALEKENQVKSAAIQERDAKDAAIDMATKSGADAKNAGVIWRAIKGDLEYDDGTPTNLKTLIDDLKETTPHLFKAPTGKADAGAGNNGKAKSGSINDWIRQQAGYKT